MKVKVEVTNAELELMNCDSLKEFEEQLRHQLDKGVVTDDGGIGLDWSVGMNWK